MNGKARLKLHWGAGIFLALGFGLLLWGWSYPATGRTPISTSAPPAVALQPDPTRTPARNPTATPPTQGGHGHDIFYLYCMPCHGDSGQGLTDEFRLREYPPEDTN